MWTDVDAAGGDDDCDGDFDDAENRNIHHCNPYLVAVHHCMEMQILAAGGNLHDCCLRRRLSDRVP